MINSCQCHQFFLFGDLLICQHQILPREVTLINATERTVEAYNFQQAMPPIDQEVYDNGRSRPCTEAESKYISRNLAGEPG